ncbi:hypothetical protein M409DRAFT_18351 [Zasmidium cellare ATCC 36951]|uniref:Apple domain-containing protein n=1 Tax=Zasmidium cellare ATCC 36951 TaxID=1080233 RepID=A0A6A6CW15_ZASCE|nr:uncharacterized protein M409DRAFT_18351 [Zasmidium cellare ATCC 36951]KAF2171235.1 hypothetical protein M409DRAFT_18351 [Zasmidium cellare ATCC 36951]
MYLSLVSLAALVASAVAQSASTYSQLFCKTQLKPQQGGGGTTTKSTTLHFTETVRSVFTPTTTIIPKSATISTRITVSKTSTTTLPQTTNTFSTTLSFTDTSTVSTTVISTTMPIITEVITSTLDTTTIAASSGFIPLSSALAASGHSVAKRRAMRDRVRDVEPVAMEERASQQKIICGSDGSISYDPPQYWGKVTCYKRVEIVSTEVITSTAKKTKTIIAPRGTVTQTSFTTTTTTITETPIAASTTISISTTQTITSISTISSTTTIPVTTTSTSFAPQPTTYAACAQNNIVSFVDSKRIFNIVTTDPDNGFSFGNATTDAYSCCVQCVQNGNCGGSTYHPASGTCYFFPLAGATCDATADTGSFSTQTGSNVGFVVSNSNCGEVHLA